MIIELCFKIFYNFYNVLSNNRSQTMILSLIDNLSKVFFFQKSVCKYHSILNVEYLIFNE